MSYRIRLALIAVATTWLVFSRLAAAGEPPATKPNILWITCEDMSPTLGCYGDRYAVSPTLDKLASQGVRFTNCFTHIGVCAPSRSGLITGMYPTTVGSHHMRSKTNLPDYVKCFPEYLRQAGYYCTNNSKTDYNFPVPKEAWDESSGKAHWKNRPKGKPFFAVFNLTVTHESQIRAPEGAYKKNTARLTPEQFHDPAKAPVPPYHPDTPLVRKDWARYYDNITAMDYQVADLLQELDDAGLADSTIVFFFSDHGAGMPRGKRWLYDSSLHVPLIVRWPDRHDAGTTNNGLVEFVDFAPTMLSLAGLPKPGHMQGGAFLGELKAAQPRQYVYGARDRMDERVDMIRSVRDKQYKYIRNYQWWKPYSQNINYMNEMPTMQEWRRLAAEGKLTGPQKNFMAPTKPIEELYDLKADPYETVNLALDSKHKETLERMRRVHEDWTEKTLDLGYLPEWELQEILTYFPEWRDLPQLAETCRVLRRLQLHLEQAIADGIEPEALAELLDKELKAIGEDAGPFRVTAFFSRMADILPSFKDGPTLVRELTKGLESDEDLKEPFWLTVHLSLANALIRSQKDANGKLDAKTLEQIRPILLAGLASDNEFLRHQAVLAVDELGDQAADYLEAVGAMMKVDKSYAARIGEHISKTRGGK